MIDRHLFIIGLSLLLVACVSTSGSVSNLESVIAECESIQQEFINQKMNEGVASSAGAQTTEAPPTLRVPPRYPFNYPDKPYVCVAVQFDVTEEGNTENIEVIRIVPDNASNRYGAAASNAVSKWRYAPMITPEGPARREDVVTLITFQLN